MKPPRTSHALLFIGAVALCVQWLALKAIGLPLSPGLEALASGISVFGAALILSWAAELAQLDIPQALALAFVALVAVLPEYAVDMYFAWTAGKNPHYIAFAAANMTGGNRLLIGAGWSIVVLAYWLKTRHKSIRVDPNQRLELLALLLATVYSFVIPLKKTISLMDSGWLLALFAWYMMTAARSAHTEVEAMEEGPAEWLAQLSTTARRFVTLGLFGLAAWTIIAAAQPFAEGLLSVGRQWGIEEFILVQWLAPLASEAPEFIVATLFALRHKPSAGIGTLVSSTVNQWTLLVGMLPIAYALSAHRALPLVLDARQLEELLLTSAQSLFAITLLCDLEFSLADGLALLGLFVVPFFLSSTTARFALAAIYLVLTVVLVATRASTRRGIRALFLKSG